jgi:hypothetical protein
MDRRDLMSKTIAKIALIAALVASSVAPVAYADPGRHYGGRHAYNHGGGRGHWHNGKWIALGILGAAAAAAIADSEYRDCYYRYGRRYCD